MFRQGDRVTYVGRNADIRQSERIGWLGTVVNSEKPSYSIGDKNLVPVKFDNYAGICTVYVDNVELIEPSVDETEAFFV